MKKLTTLILAVLMAVSLLTGCQSIAEGIFSGVAGEMADRMETMEPYPFCLDQRITFGMTLTEVEALLGTPQDIHEESAGIGLQLDQHTYNWSYGEYEGTMKLMFLQSLLYNVEITVFCDEEEKAEILEGWKTLVDETYGGMPGYSWTETDFTQQTGEGMLAHFAALQTDHGIQGTVSTYPGRLKLSCLAA